MKKKILILLALLMALTLVFVACKDDPTPEETTVNVQATEEPTSDAEEPTAEPTGDPETPTAEPTGDPETPTEEEPTGDPETPTEEPTTPLWTDRPDIVTGHSLDCVFLMQDENVIGQLFESGASATWDYVATVEDANVNVIAYFGWIGVKGELGQFGYQVDEEAPVYSDSFIYETEQDIIDFATQAGADTASRMSIRVDLTTVSFGTHTVRALYKNADGVEVCLGEFVLNLKDPTAPSAFFGPDYLTDPSYVAYNQCYFELREDEGRTFVRYYTLESDPKFILVGENTTPVANPNYMAVVYRTNVSGLGGSLLSGTAYTPILTRWNADESWHLYIMDLTTVNGLSKDENGNLNSARVDFLENHAGDDGYWDVEYFAFFDTYEKAEEFYYNLYPEERPEEGSDETDPNAPSAVYDANYLGDPSIGYHDCASEIMEENGITFARFTTRSSDPYFNFVFADTPVANPNFMAISYRTNSSQYAALISSPSYTTFTTGWLTDGWQLIIVDLTTIENMAKDGKGNLINARLDFVEDALPEGGYWDVEYIAFFATREAAENYHSALRGEEPEIERPFHAAVDYLSGVMVGVGAGNVNGGDGTAVVVDAAEKGLGIYQNNLDYMWFTMGGWVAVEGGVDHYAYSINGGDLINAVDGGTDADSNLAGYIGSIGINNAAHKASCTGNYQVIASLKGYEGQTISLTFYAIPLEDTETAIPYVTVVNLAVPGEPAA